ncbi:TRAP transporter, DctM subunit [Marinobacter salarius]|jgi:tripartite ATP-independent transporter DctM subunit|uniref:TRAP transporter large permease protein n=1 Tax=Marinobacter salarius TaxID=1420917 RepID=W5YNZ2_9GAMM|nr:MULTISPECIES: TRAP transporter large permease subunit [Marinobacter]AHI30831.1 C4-dicarboxylate ABC transporter permease [Marinobacter salarius]MBQ0747879.1 TRAP transporter large permease subunit [Marinobacter sp.]MBQ0815943.1 TRAP transporter large permease subunit [Marinobacter sp.]SFL86606.1 TRAP transporter, DctM subunit [Marinobacter salarius]|tara:strand:+ start:12038 stop:13360 length:1323 start_codon:yes stop_codon:yes gene_type:complete
MTSYVAFLMFPALLILILAGFPIAFSMISVALVAGYLQFGDGVIFQLLSKMDDVATNSVLAAVPLFIFIGAMLERSGIAERLFDAVHVWTRRVPGSLGVSAVLLGTIFAAASGVVGATETVIGMLAVPIMLKHAYDKSLISGTICASGSLGTVIPPSITVIVLAPVANVSVGDLFAGLLFPGLVMAALFIAYVVGIAMLKPAFAPREEETPVLSISQKIRMTVFALVPTMALIFTVLGTILLGIATPTEAAACGAAGTLILSLAYRTFTWGILWNALRRTASITAMILLIVLGGNMFAGVFFASGGMDSVQSLLSTLGLSGAGAVTAILVLAFLAGFVLDLISVVLILIPLAMPIVTGYGVDPVWFAVTFLVVLQTSYLTPPMAPSIFYLRAITPPEITLRHMYRGVLPFIGMQLVTLVLVILFPGLVLWLPEQMSGPSW